MNAEEVFNFLLSLKEQGIDLSSLDFVSRHTIGHGMGIGEIYHTTEEDVYPSHIVLEKTK